jgi:cyclopropane fatty-acyl-phospholipid synthase-like methyltransferase
MFLLGLICLIILLHIVIMFIIGTPMVLLNKNSILTLITWGSFIFLSYFYKNNLFLLAPLLLLIINEFLYIYFNIDVFDGPSRTQLFYDITTTYFIKNAKNNTNLTEGMYLHDIYDDTSIMTKEEARKIHPDDASKQKYEKFWLTLNIKPSEYKNLRILDMGCGNGDFMKYCKSLGVTISGITISKEQADMLKSQNLDVYHGSYRELQSQFIGKYDIVTFWGSLEHITQSYPCSKNGERKADKELKNVMTHVKQYYNPESNYKLLFTTDLHMNKKICKDTINAYIVERAYGGWYFYEEPNETIGDKVESIGFEKIYQNDFTYHYYMATIIDPSHFGCPAKPNIYNIASILFGILINPQLIVMSLYTLRGEWMWQFDNKTHFYDELCETCTFVDRSKRPTTLLWSVNKLN